MMRRGSGDYILPSNDQTTLWRITRYYEDEDSGSSVRGHFWSLSRRTGVYELDCWLEVACWLPTRKAAIDVAMEYDAELAKKERR